MIHNVSIGSMSLNAAHSGRGFDPSAASATSTATATSSSSGGARIPSTVQEGSASAPGLEDDGHVETVMIRTATNTISAETPCHRHHHHRHHHGKKKGGNGRTFNDLFSPLEAERAAKQGGDVEAGQGQASR